MFKELNSKKTIKEGTDLTKMEFVKLKEFEGQELRVEGYFFTSGDYGKQVVVIANGYKVNMPSRAVALFEKISNDEEMMQAVLDGKMCIKNIRPSKTKKGTTVLFDLDDC